MSRSAIQAVGDTFVDYLLQFGFDFPNALNPKFASKNLDIQVVIVYPSIYRAPLSEFLIRMAF
jgi:hypothetical protein